MKAKIVAIGTSKGIRIPKYLLKKYSIELQVDMQDTGQGILIQPVKKAREGWEDAFKKVAGTKHDELIAMPVSDWDSEEWDW